MTYSVVLVSVVQQSESVVHVYNQATPWIVPCQAPWSMGFSRQEYWNGLPHPPPGDPPGDLADPGIQLATLVAPALKADSLATEPPGKPIYRCISTLFWILYPCRSL